MIYHIVQVYILGGIGFLLLLFGVAVLKLYLTAGNKSLKNCAINVALGPVRAMKWGPYSRGEPMIRDIHQSLKYATKKTKLTDFGGTEFIDAYSLIMTSPEQLKEKYTNLGYITAKIELGMGWVRRLKHIKYLSDHPDVKKVPLREPVFVMGLPRTGTTFIHRLLSLDPAVRAPITWELLAPVPGVPGAADTSEQERDRNKRKEYIRKLLETRKSMGDYALQKIHEVGYDLPEECLLGLSDELPILLQYFYSGYLNIDKLLSIDATGAYSYYKTILQVLSYQIGERTEARRWMLKCPVHLFYPREIGKVFPDAKFVWTHRHPKSAVPSLCSLVAATHSVYYEPQTMDVKKLGNALNNVSSKLLTDAPKHIEESGCDCAHVVYNDLIKDPMSVLKQIYQQFGWEFTPEYERIVTEHLAADKKKRDALKGSDKADLHSYSPAQFHLTEEQLSTGKYADYMKKFNVPAGK